VGFDVPGGVVGTIPPHPISVNDLNTLMLLKGLSISNIGLFVEVDQITTEEPLLLYYMGWIKKKNL
jgi:hypothetical protein